MIQRTRHVTPAGVARRLVLVAAVAVAALAGASGSAPTSGILPAAGTIVSTFGITGSISPTSLLVPGGVSRMLSLTVSNPYSEPINVTGVSVLVGTLPAGCSAADVMLAGSHASHTVPVIVYGSTLTVAAGKSANLPDVAVALFDTTLNQDGCKGATIPFTYTGTATSTSQFTPTVTLASSSPLVSGVNVSQTGQLVTLTAGVAVASTVTVPANPTGSVTFLDGAAVLGAVPLGTGGTATLTTSALAAGSHSITATYGGDTVYSGAGSAILHQRVDQQIGACVGSTNATTIVTGTVSGNVEVANGTALWLSGGTISGNVTVDPTGQLTATGGTVGGNVVSQGGQVSIQGTSVGGNVQTTNANLGIGAGTKVGGNVQPTGGGPVCIIGPLQVGKNLQVQSVATGSITISQATVGGNLQVQNNSAPVTITGNSVKGNLQVQSNTGGGTLYNNTAGGNCQLRGNTPKPGIVGTSNTPTTCNGKA